MSSIKRYRSHSFDEDLDNFTEYLYKGKFNICRIIFNGLKKLICPCLNKKRKQTYIV